MSDKTDEYIDDFFQKQKEGTATMEDIPVVRKMNNDEELTEKDLISYILMLGRSLQEVSDFLEVELQERIDKGMVPMCGMVLDGVSNDGVPMKLEVRLSVRSDMG